MFAMILTLGGSLAFFGILVGLVFLCNGLWNRLKRLHENVNTFRAEIDQTRHTLRS